MRSGLHGRPSRGGFFSPSGGAGAEAGAGDQPRAGRPLARAGSRPGSSREAEPRGLSPSPGSAHGTKGIRPGALFAEDGSLPACLGLSAGKANSSPGPLRSAQRLLQGGRLAGQGCSPTCRASGFPGSCRGSPTAGGWVIPRPRGPELHWVEQADAGWEPGAPPYTAGLTPPRCPCWGARSGITGARGRVGQAPRLTNQWVRGETEARLAPRCPDAQCWPLPPCGRAGT